MNPFGDRFLEWCHTLVPLSEAHWERALSFCTFEKTTTPKKYYGGYLKHDICTMLFLYIECPRDIWKKTVQFWIALEVLQHQQRQQQLQSYKIRSAPSNAICSAIRTGPYISSTFPFLSGHASREAMDARLPCCHPKSSPPRVRLFGGTFVYHPKSSPRRVCLFGKTFFYHPT